MNILADTFLVKGKAHKICQDYVLQGENYLIVCDGCSSSPHSDIGARILAHCLKRYLDLAFNQEFMLANEEYLGEVIIERAEMVSKVLNLPVTCLDATLLYAYQSFNEIHVIVFGDGVIFAKDRNNQVEYIKIDYEGNAPYYLSYLLDKDREKRYHDEYGFNPISRKMVYKIDDYQFVGISTDGLGSFVDYKTQEAYSLEKVIEQVVDFKSLGKEFLQKRMKRMLQVLAAQRVFHYDDIGVAGFYFE